VVIQNISASFSELFPNYVPPSPFASKSGESWPPSSYGSAAPACITQFHCKLHHACLYLVSVHQMTSPRLRMRASNCSLLLIHIPRKDERLSRPGWLTYSGQFTHISGHPSAVGQAQDRKSLPVKDQRSTTAPRNQQLISDVSEFSGPRV